MIGLENPLHIALILVVVLLVFGAKRLPEMGKSLGAGLRGFKESVTGNDTATSITGPAPTEDEPRVLAKPE
jgi:sec-independent protein translocase protein TatA